MLSMCSRFFAKPSTSEIYAANCRNTLTRVLGFSLILLLSPSFSASSLASCAPRQDDPGNHQDYLDIKKDYLLAIQAECMKRSKDSPATQQAFLKLHNKYLDVELHNIKRPQWEQLYREAEAFLKLEPTEPFSKIVAGQILIATNLHSNVLENCVMIRKSAGKMRRYSLEARLYAEAAVKDTVAEANYLPSKKLNETFSNHLNVLVEWMSQKDSPEHLQRLMFEEGLRFMDNEFPYETKLLPEFLEKVEAAKGEMKPWLRSMLLAEIRIKQGWHMRGPVFSRSAGRDAMDKYRESLKLAEKELKIAYGLHPERPEAATGMIPISMLNDIDNDKRLWFDRAVKAEFNYLPAYDRYRMTLGRRWGGSREAVIDFGIECAATKRYDTRVPLMLKIAFDEVYLAAEQSFRNDLLNQELMSYMRQFDLYPQIQKVCENYERHIKETGGFTVADARYYRNISFTVAYTLGRLEDAYELVKKYHSDVVVDKYRGTALTGYGQPTFNTTNSVTIAHVFAANGAAADEVQLIEDQTTPILGMDRTLEESEALLSEIEAAAAKNDLPEAELYFQTKKELLTKEVAFHRGDWVSLDFTPDMRHWRRFGGRYKPESLSSLVAVNSNREKQYLYYNTSFPAPYEVEFSVEGLTRHSAKSQSQPIGLICGEMFGSKTGLFFWVDPYKRRVGQSHPRKALNGFTFKNTNPTHMKVSIFAGYYEVFNGTSRIMRYQRDNFKPGLIGMGIGPWFLMSGEARYSEMRIRKLNVAEAPALDDYEGQVKHYTKLLEKEKSFDSYFSLGSAYSQMKQYDNAVEAFTAAEKILPKLVDPSYQSGRAMVDARDFGKADKTFERALEKAVDDQADYRVNVLNSLTWLHATCPDAEHRDGEKAVTYAEEMVGLLGKKDQPWTYLDTIAAAYAEAGEFENAVKYGQMAIKQAGKAKKGERKSLQERLELYQDGKPFHEK